MHRTPVSEVMSATPHLVEPSATLREAARRMNEFECGALPVCQGDKLVGIITDRDIVCFGLAAEMDADKDTVASIMTNDVFTCETTTTLEKVADIMSEQDVRRLVVEDERGKVVGIVSMRDIIKRTDSNTIDDDVVHHLFHYA